MKINSVTPKTNISRVCLAPSNSVYFGSDSVAIKNNVDNNFDINVGKTSDSSLSNFVGKSFGVEYNLNCGRKPYYPLFIRGNIGDKDVDIKFLKQDNYKQYIRGKVGDKEVDLKLKTPILKSDTIEGKFGNDEIKISISRLTGRGGNDILIGGNGVDMQFSSVYSKKFGFNDIKQRLIGKYYIDKDFLPVLMTMITYHN